MTAMITKTATTGSGSRSCTKSCLVVTDPARPAGRDDMGPAEARISDSRPMGRPTCHRADRCPAPVERAWVWKPVVDPIRTATILLPTYRRRAACRRSEDPGRRWNVDPKRAVTACGRAWCPGTWSCREVDSAPLARRSVAILRHRRVRRSAGRARAAGLVRGAGGRWARPPHPRSGKPPGPDRVDQRQVDRDPGRGRRPGPGRVRAGRRRRGRYLALPAAPPGGTRRARRRQCRRDAHARRSGPHREPDTRLGVRRAHHPVRSGHRGHGVSGRGTGHRSGHPVRRLRRHHGARAGARDRIRVDGTRDPGLRPVRGGRAGWGLDDAPIHAGPAGCARLAAALDRHDGPLGVRRGGAGCRARGERALHDGRGGRTHPRRPGRAAHRTAAARGRGPRAGRWRRPGGRPGGRVRAGGPDAGGAGVLHGGPGHRRVHSDPAHRTVRDRPVRGGTGGWLAARALLATRSHRRWCLGHHHRGHRLLPGDVAWRVLSVVHRPVHPGGCRLRHRYRHPHRGHLRQHTSTPAGHCGRHERGVDRGRGATRGHHGRAGAGGGRPRPHGAATAPAERRGRGGRRAGRWRGDLPAARRPGSGAQRLGPARRTDRARIGSGPPGSCSAARASRQTLDQSRRQCRPRVQMPRCTKTWYTSTAVTSSAVTVTTLVIVSATWSASVWTVTRSVSTARASFAPAAKAAWVSGSFVASPACCSSWTVNSRIWATAPDAASSILAVRLRRF